MNKKGSAIVTIVYSLYSWRGLLITGSAMSEAADRVSVVGFRRLPFVLIVGSALSASAEFLRPCSCKRHSRAGLRFAGWLFYTWVGPGHVKDVEERVLCYAPPGKPIYSRIKKQ